MKKYHEVKKIEFTDDEMTITIDGKQYHFQLNEISSRLNNAPDSERRNYQISPSGYGIYWPAIDEDLSIDGLLGIKHKPLHQRKDLSYK
jgi:hypothetical protein